MLLQKLAIRFSEKFPDQTFRLGEKNNAARLVIPAKNSEFGDIEIEQEGEELILVAGHLTHVHFASYDNELSPAEKYTTIVDEILEFLDAVFNDRVVFWSKHRSGGGCYVVDADHDWSKSELEGNEFVWSGPLVSKLQLGRS
ncbi:MAG: hypothetical protein EAZ21_12950 [Betaproteobacteria bacterium]|nr:MAG: hypothetical protein EAZ21_12950 [Betaproteobacteria bacterium]